MNMQHRVYLLILASCMSSVAYSQACTDVLKLSAISTEIVESEESFLENAEKFCDEYSKSEGGSNASGGNVGYGGFSLGYSSASSDAESIAKKLCESSDMSELRDNAYSTYIREVAPQAYDSYNQCIASGNELSVQLLRGAPLEAALRVAYSTKGFSQTAKLDVDSESAVSCDWETPIELQDGKLELGNGQSVVLVCNRENSDSPVSITVLNENSSSPDSFLTIPWSGYDGEIPVSLRNRYHLAIQEVQVLQSQMRGGISAFDSSECPNGWSEFTEAAGMFIRGMDKSGLIDPDGIRDPGSVQEDAIERHRHSLADAGQADWDGRGYAGKQRVGNGGRERNVINTSLTGGTETRPTNIALLYCQKN